MLIADAQVHIWAANTPDRPWGTNIEPHRPVPFSKDDALREMDAAGVDRAMLVPPSWIGERNDIALEAAQLHPNRFAVMGRLDINAPDARGKITTWRQQPGMLGLRFPFKIKEDFSDDWVWAEAEAASVPIMTVSHAQLPLLGRAAERHPRLKFIIDQFGIPAGEFKKGSRDDKAFVHLDGLLALKKYPNIAVKASSLPSYSTDTYPYRKLHPHIKRVYDAFGPRRIFWGTDLTKMPCTYRQSITMFTEEIPWLSESDKEWIMGRGLCEWAGWKMP